MSKHYFTTSIAPVSYGAYFVPFPIGDVVECFEKWAKDPAMEPFHDHGSDKGTMTIHVTKVSARREELPALLKPQNNICRFVIVPTQSKWTAILSPHCVHNLFGPMDTELTLTRLGFWMARRLGLPKHTTCSVAVRTEPLPPATILRRFTLHHCPSRGIEIYTTGNYDQEGSYGDGLSRLLQGHLGGAEDRSWSNAPLESLGLTDAPEIGIDIDLKKGLTGADIEHLWEIFNFDHIDYICQQLGLHVFDDAFYGTTGYLVQPWYEKYEYFHIEDRIPFAKYQEFCRLDTDGIRAWTSDPTALDHTNPTTPSTTTPQ